MKCWMVAIALGTATAQTAAADPPRDVAVTGTRVHLGDLLANVDATEAAVDLGPSPAAGGSRLVSRAEIVSLLNAQHLAPPAAIPDAVRVVRRARHLQPAELEVIVRDAIGSRPLGRGVSLTAVRIPRAVDVADGWSNVEVDVPRAPKKVGAFTTTAIASFFTRAGEVIGRVAAPVELTVSPNGALYDSTRGSAVTLVLRRGLVEVRAAGVAMADADVGDVVPVQLRPSGRVLRARLITTDEALAVEDGR